MHEIKDGKLKSGSGDKITSRKQAIAIDLSEARKAGLKFLRKSGIKILSILLIHHVREDNETMSWKDYNANFSLPGMREKVRRMKQNTLALYYAYRNLGTPWTAKVLIWLTVGYLLCPIDLIPDFIPVLGLLDDLIIVPLLIIFSIKLIPKGIWTESLHRAEQEPLMLRKSKWFIVIIILLWIGVLIAIWHLIKNNLLGK